MTESSSDSFPTPVHYEMLLRAQRSLADVSPKIAKAEACGIDCRQYKEGHAYLSDTVARFIREYFPDQIQPPTGTGLPRRPE